MKKLFALVLLVTLILCLASCGDIVTVQPDGSQQSGVVDNSGTQQTDPTKLGDYNIDIKSCRLATSYDDKPIVIVNYSFTNNGSNAISFTGAVSDEVFQNGIGLNGCYFVDDSANFSADNQTKEIKTGATLDVEVAYELNDTTTDIEVEVSEFISFSDKKVTKTFKIAE